jgi:hypothetical protein
MNWNLLKENCRIDGDSFVACWIWNRRITPQGYPATDRIVTKKLLGAKSDALHVAVAMEHVWWSPGMHARHGCSVKSCLNPRHVIPGTRSENMQDRVFDGTQNTQVLTKQQVLEIRSLRGQLTRKQIAAKYNISASNAKKVICGHTWKQV